MNEPAAASEQIAETEPGVDPNLSLNPHMGHLDPDQASDDAQDDKPKSEEQPEKEADSPPAGEDNAEKQPDDPKPEDDDVLRKKVGELAFENRQLKRQLEAQQATEAEDAGEPAPEPLKTLKDFEYDEQAFNEYLIGVAEERVEKRLSKKQTKVQADTEAQRRADEFAAREDAFEAENPGFKERLHDENLRISQEMAMFISDPSNDVGLHVGDYLSRNPTEAARIAGLPAPQQMREMVGLETRIGKEVAKAKAEKEKASKAPEPPANPIDGTDPGGASDPTNPADADKMSDEEWLAARNKQLNKRKG